MMSFDLKNKIKLSGYCDKSQRAVTNQRQASMAGMIGGTTERMDVAHQEQNFVKKTF